MEPVNARSRLFFFFFVNFEFCLQYVSWPKLASCQSTCSLVASLVASLVGGFLVFLSTCATRLAKNKIGELEEGE